jgi:hypothetical protein
MVSRVAGACGQLLDFAQRSQTPYLIASGQVTPPDHPQRDCAPASPCWGIFLANAGRRQDTLAAVRRLLGHIPKERRALSSWQHIEAYAAACAAARADCQRACVV